MNKYYEELGGHSDIRLSCNKCGRKTDDLYLVTKGKRDFLFCVYHTLKIRGKHEATNKDGSKMQE